MPLQMSEQRFDEFIEMMHESHKTLKKERDSAIAFQLTLQKKYKEEINMLHKIIADYKKKEELWSMKLNI